MISIIDGISNFCITYCDDRTVDIASRISFGSRDKVILKYKNSDILLYNRNNNKFDNTTKVIGLTFTKYNSYEWRLNTGKIHVLRSSISRIVRDMSVFVFDYTNTKLSELIYLLKLED